MNARGGAIGGSHPAPDQHARSRPTHYAPKRGRRAGRDGYPPEPRDELPAIQWIVRPVGDEGVRRREWDVFHLHMATAIEQLIKCVLARINPLFIADSRGGFDTLLHLAGMGHRASSRSTAIRTIAVSESLERVRRVLDPYQEPGAEVRVLLDVRDAIVHGGAATQTQTQADVLLGESARYIGSLLEHAGTTSAEYWGDLEEIVQTHMASRLTEIEGTYERRLQTARDRYAELLTCSRARSTPCGPLLSRQVDPSTSRPFRLDARRARAWAWSTGYQARTGRPTGTSPTARPMRLAHN